MNFLLFFVKEDHILIYMYIFAIALLLGTVLHCITWFVWLISRSLELIWVNFSTTLLESHHVHLVGCTGWKPTSAVPWGNNVSVTSQLIEYANSEVNNDIVRTTDILPSKWQRQLFLLKCFMSSYDRFKCKNNLASFAGLCSCTKGLSFLLDCFVKIWATCENFWANDSPPPLAKNCPYAYARWSQHSTETTFLL